MKFYLQSFTFAVVLCFGYWAFGSEVTFEKKKIQIKSQTLEVEWAETEVQLQRGLMFRQSLPEGKGMFFIFDQERILSFWMKNTLVRLSIAFIDAGFKIVDIQDMEPVKSVIQTSFPSYSSRHPAKYALEVPQGWFTKHKIGVGDKVLLLDSKNSKD